MSGTDLSEGITESIFFDLEALEPSGYRVKLRFTGADRVRYLNGQVSNDTRRLKAGPGEEALAACVMNAKGKMNAYCRIHAAEEALFLDAEGDGDDFREALAMRMERYIIADDVELTDVSEELAILHFIGREEDVAAILPEEGAARWRRADRFAIPGIDLIVPIAEKEQWAGKLRSSAREIGAEEAELFRIRQGVPRWGKELDENTLPAEAGLDASAIDFHKGCYIGQEIISRIKSVGRVNRRLTRIVAKVPLAAGMVLYNREEKVAGAVTSAAFLEQKGRSIALAYVRRGNEEGPLWARGESAADGDDVSIPVELWQDSPIS